MYSVKLKEVYLINFTQYNVGDTLVFEHFSHNATIPTSNNQHLKKESQLDLCKINNASVIANPNISNKIHQWSSGYVTVSVSK